LAIGHVTWDLRPEGRVIGGTAAYAGITAARLGLKAAILTSCGPGLLSEDPLPGVEVRSVSARQSTVFENRYEGGGRTQRLLGHARRLGPADLPNDWRHVPLVLLGPVAKEVSPLLAGCFPGAMLAVTPQGWMRSWDSTGAVQLQPWRRPGPVLKHTSVLIVSHHDLTPAEAESYAAKVPTLAITLGSKGSRLHSQGAWLDIPSFPVDTVDPTGAGDVYAAALLVRLQEGAEPFDAARFASCAASFVVQAVGTAGIPTRAQVEERLRAWPVASGAQV
jgi:sugar/nucleoside kinase (ribokinase family)